MAYVPAFMTSRSLRAFLIFAVFLYSARAMAQQRPVGQWRAHLPYNSAQGVATDGATLYTISEKGFFTYNAANGEQELFSKVNGLANWGESVFQRQGFEAPPELRALPPAGLSS